MTKMTCLSSAPCCSNNLQCTCLLQWKFNLIGGGGTSDDGLPNSTGSGRKRAQQVLSSNAFNPRLQHHLTCDHGVNTAVQVALH